MNKFKFYIWIFVAALFVTSCSDDDDDDKEEIWKQKNEQAFNEIANNPEYTELKTLSYAGSIYYKVLKEGEEGGKKPTYKSRAEVYYKGMFAVTDEDKNIKKGDVFDQKLFEDGTPFNVAISAAVADYSTQNPNGYAVPITGWVEALQHMVVGDKWEVWIPYHLAYGKNGGGSIPGYATLVFEIELLKVIDINDI